jgi:hypothetical protein
LGFTAGNGEADENRYVFVFAAKSTQEFKNAATNGEKAFWADNFLGIPGARTNEGGEAEAAFECVAFRECRNGGFIPVKQLGMFFASIFAED